MTIKDNALFTENTLLGFFLARIAGDSGESIATIANSVLSEASVHYLEDSVWSIETSNEDNDNALLSSEDVLGIIDDALSDDVEKLLSTIHEYTDLTVVRVDGGFRVQSSITGIAKNPPLQGKATVLETSGGRVWCTVTDESSLIMIGHQMYNALREPNFAKMYSGRMRLFFLMEKGSDKVLVNASFNKIDLKEGMILGPKNMPYNSQYEDDVKQLRDYVAKLEI